MKISNVSKQHWAALIKLSYFEKSLPDPIMTTRYIWKWGALCDSHVSGAWRGLFQCVPVSVSPPPGRITGSSVTVVIPRATMRLWRPSASPGGMCEDLRGREVEKRRGKEES